MPKPKKPLKIVPPNQDNYLALEQLNGGFNIDHRIIYIDETIDLYEPTYIQERVHMISKISGDDKTPITLQITSLGGDAYALFGSLDLLKTFSMPINTFGVGVCMSAAAILLICATGTRRATENTTIMLHNFQIEGGGGDSAAVKRAMEFNLTLETKMYKLLEKHSAQPESFWREHASHEMYLTAAQALEYKVIDEIVYGPTQKAKSRTKTSSASS